MNREKIVSELFRMRDKLYTATLRKIIPTVEADRIIGVRTPELKAYARILVGDEDIYDFLSGLPHRYFEENQLHAFVISLEKEFDSCVSRVESFLPFVDNWATCDQLLPKAFKKEPERLLPYIRTWIRSDRTYTVRFAVGLLMRFFLDERFELEYADMVAEIRSDEYYINMMRAWYFATALAKRYSSVLSYLEEKRLDDWTHDRAIRKSVESRRIPDEQKQYLRALKAGRAVN